MVVLLELTVFNLVFPQKQILILTKPENESKHMSSLSLVVFAWIVFFPVFLQLLTVLDCKTTTQFLIWQTSAVLSSIPVFWPLQPGDAPGVCDACWHAQGFLPHWPAQSIKGKPESSTSSEGLSAIAISPVALLMADTFLRAC